MSAPINRTIKDEARLERQKIYATMAVPTVICG